MEVKLSLYSKACPVILEAGTLAGDVDDLADVVFELLGSQFLPEWQRRVGFRMLFENRGRFDAIPHSQPNYLLPV